MNKRIFVLGIIITIAATLRLYKLGDNPPGMYWDEVSLGYNAYSILKTGRDEHNEFLPYSRFKAFGDYKPPGYIYATVPSIALFGLNNFAVRLPSALAGTLTVLATYFLVKELFPKSKKFSILKFQFSIAEVSALLLAISPWHLQISRAAFEANLAALFNLLAIYLFLKSRKKPWLLIFSSISFVATLYTFNANRLLSILIVILLASVYWRHLWRHKKAAVIAAIIGLVFTAPLIPHLRSPEGVLRWHEVNIFADLDVILDSNQRITLDGEGRLAKLAHHRYLGHATNFLRHYFHHFNGRYLFLRGDVNPRFSVQEVGQLYLIELPFLLIGFYALTKLKNRQSALTILGWFFLGPVPAAMARETPHALRTLSMLPTPHIIIALGLVYSVKLIKIDKRILFTVYCLLFTASLVYFQIIYYRYYPQEYAGEWLTSYPRLVNFLNTSEAAINAKKITVTSDLGRPYIYFLFYGKYPPDKYAAEVRRTGNVFSVFTVHGFDKYEFGKPGPEVIAPGDILVIRAPETYANFELLTTISDINGFPEFNVLKKL